ncbi:hypothetical protein D3C74_200990 [compost metagenome]
MDTKPLSVNVSIKSAWWLRPVAYTTYFFMKLFRCDQEKIDTALDSVFRRAFKYKVGKHRWKKVYGTK